MTPGACLAAVLGAAYVLAGGLELGLGVLTLFVARDRDRDVVREGVGGPWLAGALWTVPAFALLVGGFPQSLEYLRALWPPLAAMLAGLALRGAASAIRPLVLRRDLCDLLHGLASLLAAASLGLVLGWFLHAAPFRTVVSVGGASSLASPWGLLGAAEAVGAYALLAAGWLTWAARGAPRVFAREVGRSAVILTLGAAVLSLLWATLTGGVGAALASGWLHAAAIGIPALVVLAAGALAWRSLWGRSATLVFAAAAALLLAAAACMAAVLAHSTLLAGGIAPSSLSDGSFPDYLAFGLLIGSPLIVVSLSRMRRALARADSVPASGTDREPTSHAGRRPASLANELHLS